MIERELFKYIGRGVAFHVSDPRHRDIRQSAESYRYPIRVNIEKEREREREREREKKNFRRRNKNGEGSGGTRGERRKLFAGWVDRAERGIASRETRASTPYSIELSYQSRKESSVSLC